MSQYKQIGEVADKLNINAKTIRYYEHIGLIPEPHRSEAGYRLFAPGQGPSLAARDHRRRYPQTERTPNRDCGTKTGFRAGSSVLQSG
ncbi:MAG TPA: MerR family DNA-binding transcriptional regulator [Anaerolineae bacterium]